MSGVSIELDLNAQVESIQSTSIRFLRKLDFRLNQQTQAVNTEAAFCVIRLNSRAQPQLKLASSPISIGQQPNHEPLTAFCPSRTRCGSSNCDISAPVAPLQMHAFCLLWRTAGRDSPASTPCLFVVEKERTEKKLITSVCCDSLRFDGFFPEQNGKAL